MMIVDFQYNISIFFLFFFPYMCIAGSGNSAMDHHNLGVISPI